MCRLSCWVRRKHKLTKLTPETQRKYGIAVMYCTCCHHFFQVPSGKRVDKEPWKQ